MQSSYNQDEYKCILYIVQFSPQNATKNSKIPQISILTIVYLANELFCTITDLPRRYGQLPLVPTNHFVSHIIAAILAHHITATAYIDQLSWYCDNIKVSNS